MHSPKVDQIDMMIRRRLLLLLRSAEIKPDVHRFRDGIAPKGRHVLRRVRREIAHEAPTARCSASTWRPVVISHAVAR